MRQSMMLGSDSESSSSFRSRKVVPDDEDDLSGGSYAGNTPDSSLPSSPGLPSKAAVAIPMPFCPPSLEESDLNRQCPPLPSIFPAVPHNETPRITAVAVSMSYLFFIESNFELNVHAC